MALTKAKMTVLDLPFIISSTHLSNGLMSIEDKTKLDGIEIGATGDQTPQELLDLLKTTDGTGSGLDLDLLDGQQGSWYNNVENLNAGTIQTVIFNDISHGDRGGGSLHSIATSTINGFHGFNDKVKMDTIEPSATGDQTPAELIADLITVDGSGSGLDADKLDGQEGSFYQNADNLNNGIILTAQFDDTSHGNRGGGTLHSVVTQAVAGFMSPADKAKLDSLI